MNLKEKYQTIVSKLTVLDSLPLLFMRLILAVGFFGPAKMKLSNIAGITLGLKV